MKKKTVRCEVTAKKVLRGLLRSQRDCSIGMYLVLLELAGCAESLSCTALERRVKCPGLQNPRQLLSTALGYGWVVRTEVEGDISWGISAAGRMVVAGMVARLGVSSGFENDALERECEAGRKVRDAQMQFKF